jgi:hypothetical protein
VTFCRSIDFKIESFNSNPSGDFQHVSSGMAAIWTSWHGFAGLSWSYSARTASTP